MGPLQIVIFVNLLAFISLSLWAHFNGESKSRITYFLTAICGEFLLMDEFIPFIGGNNFLISIVYLSISAIILSYTLVIPHTRLLKILKNYKLAKKVPDEAISNLPDKQVEKAHQLLNEE